MPLPPEFDRIRDQLSRRITAVFGSPDEILFVGENFGFLTEAVGFSEEALTKAGLIRGAADLPRARAAFWEELEVCPETVCVTLEFHGNLPREAIQQGLLESLITVDSDAPLRLILTDDYLRPALEELNRSPRPYLLGKPVGREIWIGPMVRPGETAGWDCLAFWLRSHRWRTARFTGWEFPPQPSIAVHPASLRFAIGLISLHLLRAMAKRDSVLENTILTWDILTDQHERHPIKARVELPAPQRFVLEDWVSRYTGIVEGLSGPADNWYGLWHVRAGYVLSCLPGGLHRVSAQGYSYGWGFTREEARRRALAEALERYCITFRGDEHFIHGSHVDTCGVHPAELLTANRQSGVTVDQFHEDVPIDWMRAESLTGGTSILLPAALVLLDYQDQEQPGFAYTTSIGCAAGETRDDAIKAGLFELLERYARAQFEHKAISRQRVNFDDKQLEMVIDAVRRSGRSCELIDISTSLPGFVYAAVSLGNRDDDPVMATAAHMDANIAARRAIGELCQILVWRALNRDQRPGFPNTNLGFLRPTTSKKSARHEEPVKTAVAALADVVGALANQGLESYAVDLTRRDVGVPVWRVIIRGL